MALGEYPVVNLAQARERQFVARKKLAVDLDPMAERKAEAETRQREADVRPIAVPRNKSRVGTWPATTRLTRC